MKINVITLDYTRKELVVQFDNIEDMRTIADSILNHGKPTKNDMDNQILSHINRGNRIDAIRYHRQVTGSLLLESKQYCDQIGIDAGVLVYADGIIVYKDSPAARGYSEYSEYKDYEGDRP